MERYKQTSTYCDKSSLFAALCCFFIASEASFIKSVSLSYFLHRFSVLEAITLTAITSIANIPLALFFSARKPSNNCRSLFYSIQVFAIFLNCYLMSSIKDSIYAVFALFFWKDIYTPSSLQLIWSNVITRSEIHQNSYKTLVLGSNLGAIFGSVLVYAIDINMYPLFASCLLGASYTFNLIPFKKVQKNVTDPTQPIQKGKGLTSIIFGVIVIQFCCCIYDALLGNDLKIEKPAQEDKSAFISGSHILSSILSLIAPLVANLILHTQWRLLVAPVVLIPMAFCINRSIYTVAANSILIRSMHSTLFNIYKYEICKGCAKTLNAQPFIDLFLYKAAYSLCSAIIVALSFKFNDLLSSNLLIVAPIVLSSLWFTTSLLHNTETKTMDK